MDYKVELTAEAIANIRDIHDYIDAGQSQAVSVWYRGLCDTIFTLDRLPHRGRVTPEDSGLRQLLYEANRTSSGSSTRSTRHRIGFSYSTSDTVPKPYLD